MSAELSPRPQPPISGFTNNGLPWRQTQGLLASILVQLQRVPAAGPVRARGEDAQRNEILVGCNILNRVLELAPE